VLATDSHVAILAIYGDGVKCVLRPALRGDKGGAFSASF
jgi:hypothetical protein